MLRKTCWTSLTLLALVGCGGEADKPADNVAPPIEAAEPINVTPASPAADGSTTPSLVPAPAAEGAATPPAEAAAPAEEPKA